MVVVVVRVVTVAVVVVVRVVVVVVVRAVRLPLRNAAHPNQGWPPVRVCQSKFFPQLIRESWSDTLTQP